MTPPTPTDYEQSLLAAQWFGAIATAVGAALAGLFGYLTLANSRRSKDNQERATLTAAALKPGYDDFGPIRPRLDASSSDADARIAWSVLRISGELWEIKNVGTDVAYAVTLAGLTELDRKRIMALRIEPQTVPPDKSVTLMLASRLTMSGPANVVISYSFHQPGIPLVTQTLLVPAT